MPRLPFPIRPDGCQQSVPPDPDLNPTYQNVAMHYGFGVLAARPSRPRDKAVVESAVQVTQRWIVAALRHRTFFELEETYAAIRELPDRCRPKAVAEAPGDLRGYPTA